MNPDELARLLDAYRDGDITAQEAGRLTASMRESGETSNLVLGELQTEGLIAQALDDTDDESFLRGFWERHRAEQDGEHFVHDFEEKRVEESADRSRRSWIAAAIAATAVFMIAAGASYWMLPNENAVARLDLVRGEVAVTRDGTERRVHRDSTLFPGDGLRVTGEESAAAIVFADGTRLEFGEDTLVTSVTEDATTGKRVVLSAGFFTAQVAKQPPGRPMILATPNSEVVVLGTTFSLSVGTQVTHLATQSGNVRLRRTGDGRSVEVPAGYDAVVAGVGGPLMAQAVAPRSGAPRLELEGCWNGALSLKGDALAATRYVKGDVEIWSVASGQRQAAFRAHDKRATTAAFTQDGATIVTGSLDGMLKWWDRSTSQLSATLDPGIGEITELRLANGSRSLTVLSHEEGSETRTLTSWDLDTRQPRWGPVQLPADRLVFSPDGSMLATATKRDRFVTVWNLRTGRVEMELGKGHAPSSGMFRNVFSMAFSHDGHTLAVDDVSGVVTLWDLSFGMGKVRDQFVRHGGRIFGMGFSPDDRFLATGQQDDVIRLWDVASGTQVASFAGHPHTQARDVTFSHDGRMLLTRGIRLATSSATRDGILQLWDLPASLIPTKNR